jgi:hypothetical protein
MKDNNFHAVLGSKRLIGMPVTEILFHCHGFCITVTGRWALHCGQCCNVSLTTVRLAFALACRSRLTLTLSSELTSGATSYYHCSTIPARTESSSMGRQLYVKKYLRAASITK